MLQLGQLARDLSLGARGEDQSHRDILVVASKSISGVLRPSIVSCGSVSFILNIHSPQGDLHIWNERTAYPYTWSSRTPSNSSGMTSVYDDKQAIRLALADILSEIAHRVRGPFYVIQGRVVCYQVQLVL